MSQLVARLLLSLLLMPVASLAYLLAFFALDRIRIGARYDEQQQFAGAGAITFVLIIAYWLGLWVRVVKWNGARGVLTGIAVPGAAVVGAVVYAMIRSVGHGYDRSFAAFIGSAVAPLIWLVTTVLIWRETAAERAERLRGAARGGVACPTCGYNLTGLTTTRCPECGTQFTLDELLAERGGKDAADLDEDRRSG